MNKKFKVTLKSIKTLKLSKAQIKSICELKNTFWRWTFKKQINWFKINVNKNDLNNLLIIDNELVGYNLLRKRKAYTGSKSFNYFYLDSFIINEKFRYKNLGKLLMKFNNKIIIKKKIPGFLTCHKNVKLFYKKNNWILSNKNDYELHKKPVWFDRKSEINGLSFNLKQKRNKFINYTVQLNEKIKPFSTVLFMGRNKCEDTKKIKVLLKKESKKFFYFESHKIGEKINKKLLKKNYDYIFCFRSFYILKENLLKRVKKVAINFHPGPPEYRGTGCVNYAVYNNSKFYGCTAHIINTKVDDGAIIDVQKFSITNNESVSSILKKTHKSMCRQAMTILNDLKDKQHIISIRIKNSKKFKWSKKIKKLKNLKKFYEIDPNISKEKLFSKIRATETPKFKPYINVHGKIFTLN